MGMHVVIMAGGTGGHIFPALAVAQALQTKQVRVTWLGAAGGMETELVPQRGIAMETLPIKGLRGNGMLGWLLSPYRVGKAVWLAIRLLNRLRPQVVIGMGGFVSGPGGVAARLSGIPLVIHEQNAIAGMTNRWLAKIANAVFYAFPQAFYRYRNQSKYHLCGNPVRQDILAVAPPEQRFARRQGPLNILVLGGSLGALVLNEVVPEVVAALPGEKPIIRHQAGKKTLPAAQEAYQRHQVVGDVTAFIDDMAGAYATADLVICRAGALTIAELAAVGVAAILVPYPHAVDDHQTANARYLTDAGAGWLMAQQDFNKTNVLALLGTLNRDLLKEKAERCRALAVTNAAEQVVQYCMEIAQ